MGAVLSLITTAINTAQKFREQKRQDVIDEDNRKLKNIKEPIIPPKYYLTIDERNEKITEQDDVYSVTGINNQLKRDVIPVGYSLEQLTKVGFDEEVKTFIKRREDRRQETRDLMTKSLLAINKMITSGFGDITQDDRNSLEKEGLLDEKGNKKISDKIDKWISEIDNNEITLKTIDNIVSLLQLKTGITQDALNAAEFDKTIEKQVRDSENVKDNQALMILRRALRN